MMRASVTPRPDLDAVQVYITDDDPSSSLFYDVLLDLSQAGKLDSELHAAIERVATDPRRKVRD